MTLRKIEAMHSIFGVLPDKRCEDCANLQQYDYRGRHYRKCLVYGATHSDASDWRKGYTACGLFGKDWDGRKIIETMRRVKQSEEPCKGQMTMEGEAGA